ncbi:hypothetical protein ABE137_11945 [Brevibacillus laterosporus]|uniref:hypothetical protein n=1 Tax=Brevibacillus laterosporus TaxID=1465 RepID=UPI003D1B37C8
MANGGFVRKNGYLAVLHRDTVIPMRYVEELKRVAKRVAEQKQFSSSITINIK